MDMGIKVIHTADWHLGSPRSPYKDGVNLRSQDTLRCLDELVRVARMERPDYTLVSGDVFDAAEVRQARGHTEVLQARKLILGLSEASGQVVVMRGTPNHDSAEAFEALKAHFESTDNVHVITEPQVLSFREVDVAVLPGFDKGFYRANLPGRSGEEENAAFTSELSNIVLGLRAQCDPGKRSILMAHYTVPGANVESGQVMMLAQHEPMIPQEALLAADYDLVALGHIHRPQRVPNIRDCYYPGAINAMNFNDEGQERGFWTHTARPDGGWESSLHRTPIREFRTLRFTEEDVSAINMGDLEGVACRLWRYDGAVRDRIVRILYHCPEEEAKAYKMKQAAVERALLSDGAFMLWEDLPEAGSGSVSREVFAGTTDPEENLVSYLEERQISPERIQALAQKARPIIAQAQADTPSAAHTGVLEPVEITVKNYRNYMEESFDFGGITFCTVNGDNGVGKSSLFMDAILDCLYEDPREGELTGWVRNDDAGCTGMIRFTFRVGEETYRVTRTRTLQKKGAKKRTGKGTLNLSELVDGQWEDRAGERVTDIQKSIVDIIGMDSFTFRSCALIMQDQYGLFLQARPEERGEALGTLLGLGVYREMERIAQDRAKAYGAKARELGHKIEVQSSALAGLGDPESGLAACQERIQALEAALRTKTAERDEARLLLAGQREAAQRHARLLTDITMLEEKKTAAEQERDAQRAIIDESAAILDGREEIEERVASYHAQMEKEKELAGGSALYSSKKMEAEDLQRQAEGEQRSIDAVEQQVSQKERELAALRSTEGDAAIRRDAAEYERYAGLLQEARELQIRYAEAEAIYGRKQRAVDQEEARVRQEKARLQAEKAELERRTGLLQDSGCPDIAHAECRFLADAIEAEKALPGVEKEIEDLEQSQESTLRALIQEMEDAERVMEAVGYDAGKRAEYEARVKGLSHAPEELKRLEAREGQIALMQADVTHLRTDMRKAEERLAMLRSKGEDAERERDRYAGAHEEYTLIQQAIQGSKPWIEKEKQLPVAEERKATAERREQGLTGEIMGIEREIAGKKADAEREIQTMEGMDELEDAIKDMDAGIEAIRASAKGAQTELGALQQTLEQVSRLKREIKELQGEQTVYAKEAADHETLRAAFGQDGVPHQIIRSMIPQLTDVANTILGQMTGGKMGVEFRLEKMQNKKERASLDIFIEEYGRSVLPYLSKSGGEKVKASLAVVLALAEIRSSAAGVQLGFLQIDEPPFLDAEGTQAYVDALEAIHQRYAGLKVIAITHDQDFKARFPQNVTVYKDEHGSHVAHG